MSAEKAKKIEQLELNRETIQELAENDAEAAGGAAVMASVQATACYCINTNACRPQPVESFQCTYGDSCTCISWRTC
jgi:hypothetical protein